MTDHLPSLRMATLLLAGALPALAWASWPHVAGPGPGGSRAEGAGAFTPAPERSPGVVAAVSVPASGGGNRLAVDVDGDGTLDSIGVRRGRVVAVSGATGAMLWSSIPLGISELVGVSDLDGVEGSLELTAVSSNMLGGLAVLDLSTGGVRHTVQDLDGGSGVLGKEVRLSDLDGDGSDELVFGARLNPSDELRLLDLSTPDGQPREVRVALTGEYQGITQPTVGDFDGEGAADDVAIVQGPDIDRWSLCGPADVGGVCDEVDGTVCLCPEGLVAGVWPNWIFPDYPEAQDLDGDGTDELIAVHRHPTTPLEGISVLRPFVDGPGAGTPSIEAPWMYRYGDTTVPIEAPVHVLDLDGDGSPEVFATVYNALEDELGADALAADDGLSHPGGFAVGVWSGAAGELLASALDGLLIDVGDFDTDGRPELVVATTQGDQFAEAGLAGWELDCPDDCTLQLAWSTEAAGALQFPALFSAASLPAVQALRAGPVGAETLLAWDAGELVALSVGTDGAVQEAARLPLGPDDRVLGGDAEGVLVLVDAVVRRYSLDLADPIDFALPSGGRQGWLAAAVDGGADSLIYGSHVFPSGGPLRDTDDAIAELLQRPALVFDVEGDGQPEVASWERSVVTGQLELAVHTLDGASATERWRFTDADAAGIDTQVPKTSWPFAAADVDNDGDVDLVASVAAGSAGTLLALDGSTGAVLWGLPWTSRAERFAPLALLDLVDDAGSFAPDGQPDVVLPSLRQVGVYSAGGTGPAEVTTTIWNDSARFADLDGDGDLEVVSYQSFALQNPQVQAWDLSGGIESLWGPEPADGPPPDEETVLAVADIDDAPGLDVLYPTADGQLHGRSGATGALLDGFPIAVDLGDGVTPSERAITALVVVDADGDGEDEALAGTRGGWLVLLELGTPEQTWAFRVGEPVVALAIADSDGDGEIEILVSSSDGVGRIVDATGQGVTILEPTLRDCIGEDEIAVSGTSVGVESIEVRVGEGAPTEADVQGDGSWSAVVPFTLGPGLTTVTATGLVGGLAAASAEVRVQSELDTDGDGVTSCGGDCDDTDPEVRPGLEEVCDGKDNDCDPTTSEDGDLDSDGWSFCDGDCDDADAATSPDAAEDCEGVVDRDCDGLLPADDPDCEEPDPTPPPADVDEGCDCSVGGSPSGLPLLLLLGIIRRRR